MTDEPPHTRSLRDKLLRYRGEIDNALYKAEIACPAPDALKKKHFSFPNPDLSCTLLDYPEECPFRDYNALCKIPRLRRLTGEHVEHHDIPQCDTEKK